MRSVFSYYAELTSRNAGFNAFTLPHINLERMPYLHSKKRKVLSEVLNRLKVVERAFTPHLRHFINSERGKNI